VINSESKIILSHPDFLRNEKCGTHWKGNTISSMNGIDFLHSHHLYYRLPEMIVSWCEANSAYSYYFVKNLKYYSYNKSQWDALFLKFIWYSTLHVLDRSTVHHHEYFNTVYTQ